MQNLTYSDNEFSKHNMQRIKRLITSDRYACPNKEMIDDVIGKLRTVPLKDLFLFDDSVLDLTHQLGSHNYHDNLNLVDPYFDLCVSELENIRSVAFDALWNGLKLEKGERVIYYLCNTHSFERSGQFGRSERSGQFERSRQFERSGQTSPDGWDTRNYEFSMIVVTDLSSCLFFSRQIRCNINSISRKHDVTIIDTKPQLRRPQIQKNNLRLISMVIDAIRRLNYVPRKPCRWHDSNFSALMEIVDVLLGISRDCHNIFERIKHIKPYVVTKNNFTCLAANSITNTCANTDINTIQNANTCANTIQNTNTCANTNTNTNTVINQIASLNEIIETLRNEVKELRIEMEKLKNMRSIDDQCFVCSIPMEKKRVLVPCGHRGCCDECIGKNEVKCMMCGVNIKSVVVIA